MGRQKFLNGHGPERFDRNNRDLNVLQVRREELRIGHQYWNDRPPMSPLNSETVQQNLVQMLFYPLDAGKVLLDGGRTLSRPLYQLLQLVLYLDGSTGQREILALDS